MISTSSTIRKIIRDQVEYYFTSCTLQMWEVNMEKYRPGENVPESGEYTAYSRDGQNGGKTYLEKGESFPPTQHEGSYYVKED